ncbi:MAG: porin [Acidobacteria bacterium]|nr:porin [Acidobacteriota bacterium]
MLTLCAGALSAQEPPWTERERLLLNRIEQLERRLTALESAGGVRPPAPPPPPAAQPPIIDPPPDSTLGVSLDGYYAYNFNRPAGRANLLRAYDVLSNSFSLNQASLLFERAPKPEAGRRFGLRLDLQYGQATETLQGSPANEPRPQVYRPLFQAYGTYVAPLGKGLAVDFGKWASSLGFENNYTKDQLNYSRSYLFNFLPFYHFGLRATYPVHPKLDLSYWVVNGAQQSEDFNNFKSQAVLLAFKPSQNVTWNVNYYSGVEGRVSNARIHILDSYGAWIVTPKLTLAAEADYVLQSGHVAAGAAYARYRFAPKFSLAGRAEYLSDHGGLFSGESQTLKETTVTADYNVGNGFLMRWEWRRDFSGRPFFLSETPGVRRRSQNTATVGLIWWYGGKQGAW